MCRNQKKLVFWLTLDPIFSSHRPSNPPLFIGVVEEGNLVCIGGKFQPLIQLGRTPTVGSK
jgi:hypothetical protein